MKRLNILILTLIAAVVFSSCSQPEKKEEVAAKATLAKKEVVKIMQLKSQEITRNVEYSSSLIPFEEVHLAPSVPGKIESISVEVGDKVSKGQTLAKMDDAQLIQAKLQLNNLKSDYSRLETLKKSGSIAQQQYDQMKTQLEVTEENVAYLKENTSIMAPFNGVISGKYFEDGEIYSGAPVATVGKAAIVSLIQINKLKAVVSITENYFPKIKKDMTVNVIADVYPGKVFAGKIYRIYPTIDPMSRTFKVEVSIDNKDNLLRPGMFSRVSIDMENTEAIVLPALAISKMQGSNIRYLFVEKNGVAKRVEVKLGQRFNDQVEVISDELQQGDNIVISGQARLLDGMKVQVVN